MEAIERARSGADRNTKKLDHPPVSSEPADHESQQPLKTKKLAVSTDESQVTNAIVRKMQGDVRQEGEWIVSVGECHAENISKEEAIRRALDEARLRAIEYAVGITLSSSSTLEENDQSVIFKKVTNIDTYGKIVDEQKPQISRNEIKNNKDRFGFPI